MDKICFLLHIARAHGLQVSSVSFVFISAITLKTQNMWIPFTTPVVSRFLSLSLPSTYLNVLFTISCLFSFGFSFGFVVDELAEEDEDEEANDKEC